MSTLVVKVKNMGNWIVIGILAMVVLGLVRNLVGFFGTRERFVQAESEVSSLQATYEMLSVQQNLEDEAFVVERELRNSLGLSREGESVVIIPEEMLQVALTNQQKEVEETSETVNWRKWVQLFL